MGGGDGGGRQLQTNSRLWILLSVILSHICHVSIATSDLFTLSHSELESIIHSKDFNRIRNVLKYEGALGITGLPEEYVQAVNQLHTAAPQCLKELRYPEFVLADGSLRTTFAKESGDESAIASYPTCLAQTSSTISRHFDAVQQSLTDLFEQLTSKKSLSWKNGDEVRSFSDLPNKEHIHVYHNPNGAVRRSEEEYATPFHTDNGILLLITPFQAHPLQVRSMGGQIINTATLDNSAVLVLVARALPEWLLRGSREAREFRAAPHAVQTLMSADQLLTDRTVFARMLVAPLDSIPASPQSSPVPFSHIFFNKQSSEGDLCLTGHEEFDDNFGGKMSRERMPRDTMDHHQHHHGMKNKTTEESFNDLKDDECSDPNTSYCWMGCLDLPSDCPVQDSFICTNSAGRDCCTDKADENTGKCADMDPTCTWKCGAPTTPHSHDHSSSDKTSHSSKVTTIQQKDENFCLPGTGTDMYMNGFQVSGKSNNACVILFFESWVLDSRLKFAFGCLGCILLGVVVEGLLCFRRLLQSRKILRVLSSLTRRVSIIVLFGFNIAAGYLAMLVAMTYSVELFICMVIGLVIGHAIFNTSAPVGESVDPCCASQVIGTSNNSQGSDSSHIKRDDAICMEKIVEPV
eukprot:TRINITY_DN16319_c0_g1_i1.p1 TRINITY_DN16319_c0_g1~~TRINITY_DN16319_c0_g1_i1.p1  ORF type:complete len:651 (-),score=90.21 TRINITY_DN16319_c0_g1_i1:261-2159(-)